MVAMAAKRLFSLIPFTPAGRCMFAILACAPFFALVARHLWPVLQSPALLATTQPAMMAGLVVLIALLCAADAVLFALLWRRRHSLTPVPRLALGVALLQGTGYTLISFAFGHLTSPFAVTATISTAVIGCALLGWRVVLVAVYVNVPLSLALQGLINAGVLPYAPVLPAASFVGGQPVAWWAALRVEEFYIHVLLGGTFILWAFARFDRQRLELQTLSRTDGLTRLSNRRHFMERLEIEQRRAERYGSTFSLVLCDADHFKQVNDSHGHHTGDEVLRRLGSVLNGGLRIPADVAARLGGEEFALLLTECDEAEAARVCERLRRELKAQPFSAGGRPFGVTLSMGIAAWQGGSAEALLKTADARLYAAKAGGRDRVVATLAEAGT
ncbi:MAG: hypothetical protein K0S46_1318 [Moraxellaceae bacterium]|jgi:diguanylate cyclase (GGDEF)-like protein|nr:hypothetical protein [Moraxellaceae bacterium]